MHGGVLLFGRNSLNFMHQDHDWTTVSSEDAFITLWLVRRVAPLYARSSVGSMATLPNLLRTCGET